MISQNVFSQSYSEQYEKEVKAKREHEKFVLRERYVTVMDIANELESSETRELDALRDRSVFMGAEEK